MNDDGDGSGNDDVVVPETAAEESASGWVTGVLDEDVMAGVDLSEDNDDDDDDDGEETYDQGET